MEKVTSLEVTGSQKEKETRTPTTTGIKKIWTAAGAPIC
jgi:hypothetical protein